MSFKSLALEDGSTVEGHENFKFFNKLVHGIFPESNSRGEFFSSWLKQPSHLLALLEHLNCGVALPHGELTLGRILEELKRLGYPVYTVREDLLLEGNEGEWASCLWLVLSKGMVQEECLRWVNRVCGINLEAYDNAYNHKRKVLMDLMSKLLEPIFKSKVADFQKVIDIFEPAVPVLDAIDSKRQFILLLNLLYFKFAKGASTTVTADNFAYTFRLEGGKARTRAWLLSDHAFVAELSDDCQEERYLPEKKLLSFCF
jgi:hypothetical protein